MPAQVLDLALQASPPQVAAEPAFDHGLEEAPSRERYQHQAGQDEHRGQGASGGAQLVDLGEAHGADRDHDLIEAVEEGEALLERVVAQGPRDHQRYEPAEGEAQARFGLTQVAPGAVVLLRSAHGRHGSRGARAGPWSVARRPQKTKEGASVSLTPVSITVLA